MHLFFCSSRPGPPHPVREQRLSDIITLQMMHMPFVTGGGVVSGWRVLKCKENNHNGGRGRTPTFIRQPQQGYYERTSWRKMTHYGAVCLCLVFNMQILWKPPTKTITDILQEQRPGQMFWRMVLYTKSNTQDASQKESKFCLVWTKPSHEKLITVRNVSSHCNI